jgi:hypothetical protein
MLSDFLMFAVACVAGYCIILIVYREPRKKYLVSSPQCQIPEIDPWDSTIREFVTEKVQ